MATYVLVCRLLALLLFVGMVVLGLIVWADVSPAEDIADDRWFLAFLLIGGGMCGLLWLLVGAVRQLQGKGKAE